ncbi:hypothetical protein [Acinetobacter pittii]|uniref:phosphorylase family protein n=1 Tax=Acinetobacter pittii TaxID=48296 RepID=UPI00300A20AC
MKILIVDNEPRRYRRLKGELLQLEPLIESDIIIVSNILDATEKVDEYTFDIVLLDILIPYSNVDDDDKQNCVNFLEYLHEECLNKPKRIIGITSDSDLIEELNDVFSNKAWVIFKYSDTDDKWLHNILACVNYALGNNNIIKDDKTTFDILIICALLTPELEEILALEWNWGNPILLDNNIFVYPGIVVVNDIEYKIAATYALRIGMVATSILCSRLLPLLQPKIVIMTGICAGNKEEVSLGDVVIAESCWNYQSGKLVKNKKTGEVDFKVKPHHLNVKNKIKNFFIQLSRDMVVLSELKANSPKPNISPKIKVGSLVSGASVIADDITINKIQDQQDKNICGVEMEIYGLYDACVSAYYEPIYFALKGVSDYADSEKNNDFQTYAAKNSAVVLHNFFKKYLSQIL